MISQEDANRENQKIIDALRKEFELLTKRLDHEVEPALTFMLSPSIEAES
ncbi:MAG: hypothetical protein JO138_26285 [Acidobacteriaceae bacterium]|nr:hypothetical protein [Acidobacteriaceae bacterium]